MAVKGNVKETVNYSKKVGFAEVRVLKFNPDREELEKLLGAEIDNDPEYLGEDDEGVKKLTVSVWLEEVKSKLKFNLKFFLKDKVRLNKEGTKTQFMNSTGDSSWADSADNLQSWFLNFQKTDKKTNTTTITGQKEIREAKQGEAELYAMLKRWLKLEYNDPTTDLTLDLSKMFKGNFDEVNALINTNLPQTFVVMLEVRTVETEGAEGAEPTFKEYQGVYNRDFLAGGDNSMMKYIRIGLDKKHNEYVEKALNKFKENLTGEYGSKNYYYWGPMKDYDPSENMMATTKTMEFDHDDDEY